VTELIGFFKLKTCLVGISSLVQENKKIKVRRIKFFMFFIDKYFKLNLSWQRMTEYEV
jgi:hypothetical protein